MLLPRPRVVGLGSWLDLLIWGPRFYLDGVGWGRVGRGGAEGLKGCIACGGKKDKWSRRGAVGEI